MDRIGLRHSRCIFQVLRRHTSRYIPEAVAQICGCSSAEVAELLARNSGRERTSSMVYAFRWTQHSTGVQVIRAAAIIQLRVRNIGRPGGGTTAMRGHCSTQSSTDIPTSRNGMNHTPTSFSANETGRSAAGGLLLLSLILASVSFGSAITADTSPTWLKSTSSDTS